MNPTLESYRKVRDMFLAEVADTLSRDERFVTGWLTGSISRNEADSLSDIDLTLVVSDAFSPVLCLRPEQVSAQTSVERYALFSQFGRPALIHENNNNAPEYGTFTFVLYENSAVMVDWVLVPQSKAKRPVQAKLSFDKADIPIALLPEPEGLEQRKKSVAEMWAFFWMMIAVTLKYITRNDGVFATEWIERLHALVREIERKVDGEPWRYTRGSLSQFQSTLEKQIELLQQLCQKMQELQARVTELTGSAPSMPLAEIETLFSFARSSRSEI